MSRPLPCIPWLPRWVLLFAWLLALPALGASLNPDKTEINVGEATYVKLEARAAFAVQWSASPELQILASDSDGATVKGIKSGAGTINAKWLTGKKKTSINVVDVAASKAPSDDERAVKLSGLLRTLNFPDQQARIARLLFEVTSEIRGADSFYAELGKMGAKMTDVIALRSKLVDMPDSSLARQIMGPGYPEGGTLVEQRILTWRKQQTLESIKDVLAKFSGRVPADGVKLIVSHVGKWATQDSRSLQFPGDIDFSFVSNDEALVKELRGEFLEVIKRRTKMDQIAIDSVCTAHGKAGLEVYIGRHGMKFAEDMMHVNQIVDLEKGTRRQAGLQEVAEVLTKERAMLESQGKEAPLPARNTEPGLSMEMVRHFDHDIAKSGIFDVTNAVVKAAKYLDRSYKSLEATGGTPADAKLADFAKQITAWANAKPQTTQIREDMIRLISEQLGSPPRTVWDANNQKLVLDLDPATIKAFHDSATKAMWKTVEQGSNTRTAEMDTRLRDLLDRQRRGDKVDEDVAKLRKDMVDLIDMVEAEVKAIHGGMDIPVSVLTNNAKVRGLLTTLSQRFGVKVLSAEELKDKKFVEELLKAQQDSPNPTRQELVKAYIMDRAARAAELSMTGVEKTNQFLDIIDDGLLGSLRGDADFSDFEAEMQNIRQASIDPKGKQQAVSRLSVLKGKVANGIKGTNQFFNQGLQATAAGRQGMKFMAVYGLVDEMQAYRDAFNEEGWGGFATEIFRRRIPLGSAVESAVMGNTYRAGWDVVTTLIPPLGLPEAAYGLGTMIGTKTKSAYWNEQLALFTDGLYADAIFKLEEVQSYEGAKVGAYRLVRTFHNQMPLDLHRFAEMRKDQVEALSKEVEAGHINWQAYKNNFNGLTEWLDVDATLKANLAASDPALQLLEEMANHPAVGPMLMTRLAEKGLARWEQVKLGFVTKLIKHLEDRKQADDALGRGALPDLFAELRKVAADLAIEAEVMKGLDAEVDTSNLKKLVNWLWDAKRAALGQAPTESETTRAAQAVKKYLDAYKQVQSMRDQAAGQLTKAAASDVNTRYLTSNLFLSGRADPDLAAARTWLTHIETARKAMSSALLAIKRGFLPKAGLDSNDQPYLNRAFAHEVWIKPYQDGNAKLKKSWMNDYAAGHIKERDKVLSEYKDWLTKIGPVQLTVTAINAKGGKKAVLGLRIALTPTDELGSPVSAGAAGNQVVMAVPMGRYRLVANAPGYLEASRNVVYGRGLSATPSETVSLTPSGKDPDTDKDKDKDQDKDKPAGQNDKNDPTADTTTTGAGNGKDDAGKPIATDLSKVSCGNPTGVFDKEPFNGLQLRYGISGVCVGPNKDSDGFTHSRSFDILGITGDTITVSGSSAPRDAPCHSWAGSFWFQTDVTLSVGGQRKTWSSPLPCERKSDTQYNVSQPAYSFSLSLPVPKDKSEVAVSVSVSQTYVNPRFGNRGLVVSGSGTHIRQVAGSFPQGGKDGVPPPPALLVSLDGPKEAVKFGQPIALTAKAEGGKPPYGFNWSGVPGSGASARFTAKKPGELNAEVTASDSAGQTAKAALKLKVEAPKLTLNGLPTQPVYGSNARLSVAGLPDLAPASDPCAGREYTGRNPFDECLRVRNVQTVSSASPGSSAPAVNAMPTTGATPSGGTANQGPMRYRFVWQSSPGLSFDPSTSEDGATTVTFDRMGQVKVWCEVLVEDEGAWVTLGETEQQTITVVAPAFSINFTPPDGQGKVGQEVRAKIVAKPEVPAKLIDYRWFDPGSSNRMEYTDNASEIGFKVKDAKPIKLDVLARVPHHGDEIAKIASTYTGVAYDVKIGEPKGYGPQLQVWVCDTQLGNAKNCGMKDIPKGQFVTFQDIFLKAEVTPAPPSPRYRWSVDPSGSCGLPGAGRELRLNCSSTGSYTVSLQVLDADNLLLGQAERTVGVSVSDNDVRQAPKSKEANDKMQQAKRQAGNGQLDEAINLAGAAAGLDPKNTEAKDLGKRWNDERNTVRQQVDRAKQALQNNKPDDAQKEVDAAKKLQPKYPPVLDAERELADKRKAMGQAATGKPTVETSAMPPAVGAAQPISLAGVGGNKGTPRMVKGVAVDDSSWIRFKSTDENRRSLDIPVPTPTRAAAISVVSNLDDATYLEQGKTIARIIVSKDTGDEVLEIQAGVHTSEWNYGVGPKHKRVDGADIGDNRFLVVLPLAQPGVVKAIRVEYVETNAPKWSGHAPGFCLRGISLVGDTRGLTLTPAGSPSPTTATVGGLIAAYALDGDGRDSSGNNRHGNVQGARATADRSGRAGAAMQFDGKSFIELPLDINPAVYPRLTFTAWVRADETNPIRQVMSHDDGGYDRSLGIDTRGGGAGWSAFTGNSGVLGHKPVDKGRWTFVAAIWDQTTHKTRLHVDGETFEKSGDSGTSGHKLNLGRNPGYGEFFVGAIDDVRLYDRALSPSEIAALSGATPVTTSGAAGTGLSNLARGKPASQSSTSQWSRSNDAQGAVDGVINGSYAFHTNNEANPWWQVDLGGQARIDEVRVYNRLDCCADRARTLQIQLSDDGRQWRTVYRHDGSVFGGHNGKPLKTALNGVQARHVRLQLSEANWFHLDEVEVYGQMAGGQVSQTGASLRLERDRFIPGESILVHFTAPGGWPDDAWIGIIPSNIPHGDERQNDNHDITYQYLKKRTSGTMTFTAPKAGDWDFRLHDTDNGGKEFASASFRVGEVTPTGGRDYTSTITTTPVSVTPVPGSGGPETIFQGHRYRAVLAPGGISWPDADRAARNLGGYLAVITSAAENDAVYSLVKNDDRYWFQDSYNNGIGPWLGGMQPSGSAEPRGGWRWVNGEAFNYANWGRNQPDNGWNKEDRLQFFGHQTLKSATWNDIDGSFGGVRGYIVEFGDVAQTPPTGSTGQSSVSFDNGNIGGVSNGPTQPTTFTLNEARILTLIQNYHWNSARGATPGTIALRGSDGRSYGPWQTVGTPGQGGVPNAYWTARPNEILPAGTYTVIDSNPASWSHNGQSGNRGFTRVETAPVGNGYATPGGRDYTGMPVQGQLIFEVGNIGGVSNGPSKESKFTLASPQMITLIRDYHWNSARGATPGTIAVRDGNGRTWGPWRATGSPGQGGVPNAYWTAYPNVILPAGTYTVIDSDPATWAHNGESGNRGFVRLEGYPVEQASDPSPLATTGNAKIDNAVKEVDGLIDAIKSLKGLFGK